VKPRRAADETRQAEAGARLAAKKFERSSRVVVDCSMRSIITALSRLSSVGLLLLMPVATGVAQTRPEADASRDLRRKWNVLAQGRTDFEVSELTQLPTSLSVAAGRSHCRYKEGLEIAPVRFLHTASRRLAIVTCWGPLKSFQRVFDLSDLRRPIELQFPIPAYPEGFSTSTVAPGFLNWETGTGLFRTETTSDVAYSSRARFTYRLDDGDHGFVLVRLEVQRDGVGPWMTIWDASRWSTLGKPN